MKKIFQFAFLLASLSVMSQSDAEKAASTVFKSDIESQIYFLASDELKGRETGSDELKIAAAYIANNLKKNGVIPAGDNGSFYQNVPMQRISGPKKISLRINDYVGETFLGIYVKNIDFKGDAVYLNYGSEDDFKGQDVQGKLIIVKAGTPETKDARAKFYAGRAKRALAKSMGAMALIELGEVDEDTFNRYAHYFNEPKTSLKSEEETESFVHMWMIDKGMAAAASLDASSPIKVDLKIEGIVTEKISSRNVVGYLEGSDPKLKDEFVIYSAHYDHVGIGKPNAENDSIYNGARDNAIGTVTVLSVAENFAKYPTKRSALFILFTGEEKGLLGSQYYVENPVMPLDKMVYCFNSDGAGYNDTTKITIFGLHRTTVGQHLIDAGKEFGLDVIDDPAPEQNLFDRSDNVNFAKKGIPSPTLSLGFTAFDEEINKYYHQVTDNPDNLDYDYLVKFFKSYVLSSRLIANDPVTPFWTEGDKYYEAGMELYKKKMATNEVLD